MIEQYPAAGIYIANKLSLEPHTCTHTCKIEGIFAWLVGIRALRTAACQSTPKAAISAESRDCRVARPSAERAARTQAAGRAPGQRAATVSGGRAHQSRFPFRLGYEIRCTTCRHAPWRQVPRVTWGACRHTSFANSFVRWSFPAFHSTRWSVLSKIPFG